MIPYEFAARLLSSVRNLGEHLPTPAAGWAPNKMEDKLARRDLIESAANTGTFTVIVDDAVGTSATGTYRLTLAKSPGTVFVAPGDAGGPMTNGVMHTGTIDVGDLDVWTFGANSGDAIVVRLGENVDTSGSFTPWVRLYGPE